MRGREEAAERVRRVYGAPSPARTRGGSATPASRNCRRPHPVPVPVQPLSPPRVAFLAPVHAQAAESLDQQSSWSWTLSEVFDSKGVMLEDRETGVLYEPCQSSPGLFLAVGRREPDSGTLIRHSRRPDFLAGLDAGRLRPYAVDPDGRLVHQSAALATAVAAAVPQQLQLDAPQLYSELESYLELQLSVFSIDEEMLTVEAVSAALAQRLADIREADAAAAAPAKSEALRSLLRRVATSLSRDSATAERDFAACSAGGASDSAPSLKGAALLSFLRLSCMDWGDVGSSRPAHDAERDIRLLLAHLVCAHSDAPIWLRNCSELV